MKRLALTVGTVLVAVMARPAHAQLGVKFLVGGGVQVPVGEFADYAKTGWHAMAGIELAPPLSPVSFRADGFYGRSSHEGDFGEATKLYGGTANVLYRLGAGPIRPYVIGGIGYAVHDYDPGTSGFESGSEGKFTWGGGLGLTLGLGPLNVFAEGRYLARGSETQFIPVVAGLRFGGS